MEKPRAKTLKDSYRFPGFYPATKLRGVFGDRQARVIRLARRSKKRFAERAVRQVAAGTTGNENRSAIFRAERRRFTSISRSAGSSAGAARP